MGLRNNFLAAGSCIALAAFVSPASAQMFFGVVGPSNGRLDGNGQPCHGFLDGGGQCLKEQPVRVNGTIGKARDPNGPLQFGRTGRTQIWAAIPGAIIVMDAKNQYNFVKRITFDNVPASIGIETIAGMSASPQVNMAFVSTRGHLYAIDLATDKTVWSNTYEEGTCCERGQVLPDGLTMVVGSNLKNFHRVIDTKTGVVKGIIPSPMSMFNHNMALTPDGKTVFMAPNGVTVTIGDVATMKPIGTITFSDHVRPMVINHDGTRIYANLNNLLGFEIGDVPNRKVLKRVEVPGEMWKAKWANPNNRYHGHGAPHHGIALTPDEAELWIPDAINDQVLVFDNMENDNWNLNMAKTIKTEYENGWITMGLDGKKAFMASGDVVDVKTHKIVGLLRDEYGRFMNSEKVLEMEFDGNGHLKRTVNEFAAGQPKAVAARLASLKK